MKKKYICKVIVVLLIIPQLLSRKKCWDVTQDVFICRKPWNISISEKYSGALNVLLKSILIQACTLYKTHNRYWLANGISHYLKVKCIVNSNFFRHNSQNQLLHKNNHFQYTHLGRHFLVHFTPLSPRSTISYAQLHCC